MDKKLILAVAGSGKTSYLIDSLNLDKRFIIITYTNNNFFNIKYKIIKKFKYFPDNIKLFSYYSFLHTFCFNPYLSYKIKNVGISWKSPPDFTNRLKRNDPKFYLSSNKLLYSNRIAKLLETCNVLDSVNNRLFKYFDCLMIDEVQDIAGHDFNFLKSIVKANIEILMVGDFYQHTYNTSCDGNVNINLYKDYEKYKKQFKNMGVNVDTERLLKSWRCSPIVCSFITDNIGINIQSHNNEASEITVIEDPTEIQNLFKDDSIVKLFYQNSKKYLCHSNNWGESKGIDNYIDVCIVLNLETWKCFNDGKLDSLSPVTRNKLYVACSRARQNIYFISEKNIKKFCS